MKKKHFLVSVKTIDAAPVFHKSIDGDSVLFQLVIQAASRTNVLTKTFAGFPDGVEIIAWCKNETEARAFADAVCLQIYDTNNKVGYIIETLGVHIGILTDDERTLQAVSMDIMMRSMAARSLNLQGVPVLDSDDDCMALS